jgi:type I restriction enzyme, S subunit
MANAYDIPGIESHLPPQWSVKKLGEVVSDIRPGFSSGAHTNERNGLAHLRPMNITRQGAISTAEIKYIETESNLRLRPKDVVFNNTNSLEHVGKSAVFELHDDWGFSNHITRLRPSSDLVPEFLAYQLLFLYLVGYFRTIARRHVNQTSISIKQLSNLPIITGPVEDQERAISAIQRDFSRLAVIDKTITQVMNRLDHFDDMTIEKAATGKLIHGADSVTGQSMWPTTRVSSVGQVQLGKMRSPKSHFGPQMRPYLRVANIFEDRIDFSDVHEMNFDPVEFEKFKLEVGDILLCEGQSPDLVGRPAMYQGQIQDCCFQKTLIRFRVNEGNSASFALLVFRHYLRSGQFRQMARWSTNIAHLTAIRFSQMVYPEALLAEQERTVDVAHQQLEQAGRVRESLKLVAERTPFAREQVLADNFYLQVERLASPDTEQVETTTTEQRHTMPRSSTTTSKGPRTPLLEILKEQGPLPVDLLFGQAGYSRDLVDDFYEELRELVRAGVVLDVRTDDGPELQVVGTAP